MTMSGYPGLLGGFGAPYLMPVPLVTTGKVLFVSSVIGKNDNVGDDSLRPKATWQAAYNKMRANKGDIVVLMPGHAETIPAASSITLNIAGVTTIALGYGAARPTITFTTVTAASLVVLAANNVIAGMGPNSGVLFDATGVTGVAAAIQVQAADFGFFNNRMFLAQPIGQAVIGIQATNTPDRLWIQGNTFEGSLDAGTRTAIQVVGGNRVIIRQNDFFGAYAAAIGAIENLTTPMTDALIDGNTVRNRTAASTVAMTFQASATGLVTRNRVSVLSGVTSPPPFVGANMSSGGDNVYSVAVGFGSTQAPV